MLRQFFRKAALTATITAVLATPIVPVHASDSNSLAGSLFDGATLMRIMPGFSQVIMDPDG